MKVLNMANAEVPNVPPLQDPSGPAATPAKPKPIDPPQDVPPVKLPPEPVLQS